MQSDHEIPESTAKQRFANMAQDLSFSAHHVKTIIALINNISIAGSQLMQMDKSDIWHKACSNLRQLQKRDDQLLTTLDTFARRINDEQISSLIDNLDGRSNDAAGILSIIRRCLNAAAFLAHCLAVGERSSEDSHPKDKPTSVH